MDVRGSFRRARESTQGSTSGCKTCVVMTTGICTMILLIAIILVALSLGIPKLVIGGLYFNDCDVQPMIPIFLIVDACVATLSSSCTKSNSNENDDSSSFSIRRLITTLIGLFQVAWLVMGTIWVVEARTILNSPDRCTNITVPYTTTILSTTTVPPLNALPASMTNSSGPIGAQNGTQGGPILLPALGVSQSDPVPAATAVISYVECKTCHHVLLEFALVVVIVQWLLTGILSLVLFLTISFFVLVKLGLITNEA